ncbi:MAG: ribose-phosphate diphosphokinase [Candidatus Bathyarchaeota archaeon]|nr:ribose-phosphate diphosphokinase [Candidatus Bathyarchaeota archaeon]
MIIASTNEFSELGKKIAINLNVKFSIIESKIFPDGENYIRFTDSLVDKKVIIIQSCFPEQDKKLIELFMMLDAAKNLRSKEVIAVVPYLAYSRQDKSFLDGEAISIKTIVKLIETSGANPFITVDIHEKRILDLFSINAINIMAMPEIGNYLKMQSLKKPYVIAPDKGALYQAEEVANVLDTNYTFFSKKRDRKTGEVRTSIKDVDVEGRDVVIVDDIISTGGTIANVAKIVKQQGAKEIIATCTHPLLLNDAKNRLRDAGINRIIGTDSIVSDVSFVSCANIIADALRKLS